MYMRLSLYQQRSKILRQNCQKYFEYACLKSGVTRSGLIETTSIWAVALGMFNIEWRLVLTGGSSIDRVERKV